MDKKIKIHYIWLKDYICFHNQSFNFSTQYKFNYAPETGELTFSKNNEEYIDNFFDDNIDLTAVVGMNGTGKTTLLLFMQKLSEGDLIDVDCVIVCEIDGKFCAAKYHIHDNHIIDCHALHIKNCKNIDNSIVQDYIETVYNKQRFFAGKDIRFIYLTEMFNASQYGSSTAGCDNLSFASLLYDQTENGYEEEHVKNPVLKYIHRITDWKIDFMSNGREFTKRFNIHFPSCVRVTPSYDINAFTDLYMKQKSGGSKADNSNQNNELIIEAKRYQNDFFKRGSSANEFTLADEYAQAIFMNIMETLI